MRTQTLTYEELINVIDYAGRLLLDDMDGGADVQPRAPAWAHGIEDIGIGFGCNGDALGATAAFFILEGSAFPDGPHEICAGASGGQDVDTAHNVLPTNWLKDMGIRVTPGGTYRIWGEIVCEDAGEVGLGISLKFQSSPPKKPKQWIGFEVEVAAADADVQCLNLAQVAATIDPGASTEIDGILLAAGSDLLALGCGVMVMKLSKGVEDEQQYIAGATSSELITAGAMAANCSQIRDANIKVKKDTSIYVAGRMVVEDVNMCIAGSLGLVK